MKSRLKSIVITGCFSAVFSIVGCDRDNFTDSNDFKYQQIEDLSEEIDEDTLGPYFATSSKLTQLSIDYSDPKPIKPEIYGVNNDWRRITGSMYTSFQSALEEINYKLIRFPGGFESEYYDWSENRTPDWPNKPDIPGADISAIKQSNPNAISIVIPIRLAMLETVYSASWEDAIEKLKLEAEEAVELTGADNILSVEIGNEWWLQFAGQNVEREDKLLKYTEIAKRLALHLRNKFPEAPFKILVNGDYTEPQEFALIRDVFGPNLDDIDGMALHIYTGYDSETHNIRDLQKKIDDCQANLGKTYLSLSEWAPAKAYNNGKVYAQGANLLVEQIYEHALAEADEAAFWPPTNPAIPGLGLFNFQLTLTYPTAQLFKDMATDFNGEALGVVDGDVRGAAASNKDGNIVIYITGMEEPYTTVTLDIKKNISEVVSVQMWQPGNLEDTADAIPMNSIDNFPFYIDGKTIMFNVNENSNYCIYKLVVDVID